MVTIQVIERHIIRGLEQIFSPKVVNKISDEVLSSGRLSLQRRRQSVNSTRSDFIS